MLVVVLWLSLSNFAFEASGDISGDVIPSPNPIACVNCSKCEYPCQQPSPPLPYGAPPPPSGYSIYGAPPPPQEKDNTKCPPAAGVQCCTPPAPYTFSPPNPYTHVPYDEDQGSASTILPILVPLMMLFSSFIFLF
ncbi:hypothetical protein SESBI_01371 [Sesbania bispinosa]|nr:hypothetical protein SESBI_01371 [Sesbania bispinosa]